MDIGKAWVFLFVVGLAGSVAAQTTAYPSRPIKIIAPNAPGGPTDILSRVLGQSLSLLMGQPVVVENRGGAGGTVGVDLVAKAAPDGYTLGMGGSSTLAVAPGLYAKLPYDPLRDLAPVVSVAMVPYVLAVNPKVHASSVAELIELAKSRKDAMTYGTAGNGSMSNLAMELLKSMTGINVLQVPYKGAAPYVAAMVRGEIDMAFGDLAVIAPHANRGALRMLATSSGKRAAAAAQLPTMAEAGIEGYAVEIWFGLVAPAGTPKDIIGMLNSAVVQGLAAPDVREHFARLGYTEIGGTPDQFGAMIGTEIEKFRRIIKNANIRQQ